MAVQFNASGEGYSRTGNLLGTGASTVCFWVRLDVDRNTSSSMFTVDDGGSNYWYLGTASTDGTTLVIDVGGVGAINSGVSLTVGTWYFVAITYDGTSSGVLYNAAATATSIASTSGTIGDPVTASASTHIGNDGFDEWLQGTMTGVKVWAAQLTAAEIEAERWSILPRRTVGLTAFYPLTDPSTVDYSGNGNTLTSGGTPTHTDGPPVGWGAPSIGRRYLPTGTTPTVPAAVDDLAGTAGDSQVVLTWTAPDDGGSAITDYIVQYREA